MLPSWLPCEASDIVFRGTMEEDLQAQPMLCLFCQPQLHTMHRILAGWSKTCTHGVTPVEQCPRARPLTQRDVRVCLSCRLGRLWKDGFFMFLCSFGKLEWQGVIQNRGGSYLQTEGVCQCVLHGRSHRHVR